MAKQAIGYSRLAQRTSAAQANANFDELYDLNNVVTATATAASTFVVPAGHAIVAIYISNTTANVVTGGLKFGTTVGAADVVAAQAVGANALLKVVATDVLKDIFSKTAAQTVYFTAVTAWNSANVDVRVVTRKVY